MFKRSIPLALFQKRKKQKSFLRERDREKGETSTGEKNPWGNRKDGESAVLAFSIIARKRRQLEATPLKHLKS